MADSVTTASEHRSRAITERGRFEYALRVLRPDLYERIRAEAYSRPVVENDHVEFEAWVSQLAAIAEDQIAIAAHWLENISSAAALLEGSNSVFDQREAAALRKLVQSAQRITPVSFGIDPGAPEGDRAALVHREGARVVKVEELQKEDTGQPADDSMSPTGADAFASTVAALAQKTARKFSGSVNDPDHTYSEWTFNLASLKAFAGSVGSIAFALNQEQARAFVDAQVRPGGAVLVDQHGAQWEPPTIPAGTRESAMVVIERDEHGKPTVWCDPEIVDLVGALNTRSLRTVASCSGHGGPFGNIMLADGRELLILPDWESTRFAERVLAAAFSGSDAPVAPATESREGVEWVTDEMTGAHLIDQVRMRAQFGRIEDDEIVAVLSIALQRLADKRETAVVKQDLTTGQREGVDVEELAQWCDEQSKDPDNADGAVTLLVIAQTLRGLASAQQANVPERPDSSFSLPPGYVPIDCPPPPRNQTVVYWHKQADGDGFPAIADEWRDEHHAEYALGWHPEASGLTRPRGQEVRDA